jgi:hypothetical protein
MMIKSRCFIDADKRNGPMGIVQTGSKYAAPYIIGTPRLTMEQKPFKQLSLKYA